MDQETFDIYAQIRHADGRIEERRLWLSGIQGADAANAETERAVRFNEGIVTRAWAEKVSGEAVLY